LASLSRSQHAKAIRDIELLEQFGTDLQMPHVKNIDGKLWELRIKLGSDISRIFYFVHTGKNIVLLHGYVKKSNRAPKNQIEKAKKYIIDYEGREKL
jgi:phage-related protein